MGDTPRNDVDAPAISPPTNHEAARLDALARYRILDTPREAAFDDVVALAAGLCDVPIAVVNLIGEGRQWFKAETGLGVRETPLDTSFCAHAILERDFMLVNDARDDHRFIGNPLVSAEGGLRFYAGAVLRTPDGHAIGTVCVLDHQPRTLNERQTSGLQALARQVMRELELRRTARQRDADAARLEAIMASAIDYAIIATDGDGIIGQWNTGAEAVLGWREDEALGQPLDVIFTPEDVAAGLPLNDRREADAIGHVACERFHLHRDGRRFHAHGSLMPLRGEGQQGYLKILRDRDAQHAADAALARSNARLEAAAIEQKRVEAALRESNERFEAAVRAVAGVVWTNNAAGEMEGEQPGWSALTGQDRAAYSGYRWAEAVHPDDAQPTVEAWNAAVAERKPFVFEHRVRRHDGEWRRFSIRAIPVTGADGAVREWVGVHTDITEQRANEAALRQLNETLERRVDAALAERKLWADVFETTTVQMAVCDHDLRFMAVNRAYADAFEQLFGTRPAVRTRLRDALAGLPDARAIVEPIWARALAGETGTVVAALGARERRHLEIRYSPLFDRDGNAIGAVQSATDVTDRVQGEQQLAAAEEALRQAQKMEAVGQLTGGIAHDFNNMLAVVIGSLDLLRRRLNAEDDRVLRYVDAAGEGARRAAVLTQRLLAFSRQQPLQPAVLDANRLVGGMAEMLRRSIGAETRLETVLSGGLWLTHADPNQLENVLLNLAVNARDAMPQGGRLTIETQNAHLDERYVAAYPEVAAGQYVLIAVSDTGTGMAPDVIGRVFDPFFTTKEVGKGTGLGLSQVYGFVKQTGGHVKVYSEIGTGTTVKIYLPRHYGEQPADALTVATSAMPRGEAREVVLLVEDEAAVRRFAADALADLGYRVIEAPSAADALRLLEAHPEIGLLFTDVIMPDMNGRKLADAVAVLRPELPVLFTTGYSRNAVVHNGVLDPGVELIGKPYTVEELAQKVRRVLDLPRRR